MGAEVSMLIKSNLLSYASDSLEATCHKVESTSQEIVEAFKRARNEVDEITFPILVILPASFFCLALRTVV